MNLHTFPGVAQDRFLDPSIVPQWMRQKVPGVENKTLLRVAEAVGMG